MIDFIVGYHRSLKNRDMRVSPGVQPVYLKKCISDKAALQTSSPDFAGIVDDIPTHIVPGMIHWQHPDL